MKNNNSKLGHVLTSALLLFVCVAATTTALTYRINGFMLDDTGAISLIPEAVTADTEKNTESAPMTEGTTPATDMEAAETKEPQSVQNAAPGFEVTDDDQTWTTETQVEIFKLSYENGEAIITVASSDGDKLIAPGTENNYTFKLKNTGNVALDYTVDVDAYVTPGDILLPVTARINRYDGEWVVGGDGYVDIPTLDTAYDSGVLGAGKYTYYTLDWQWPFESGNDEYDTLLGNIAAEGEDITLTIVIKTTAEADYTETGSPGITPPQTGDISHETMWFVLGGSSAVLFVITIVVQLGDKRRKRAEANTVEK